jgi:hypothetical protein
MHRITDVGDGRSNGAGQLNTLLINDITCSTIDIVQD